MSRTWICILILIVTGWRCIAQTPQIEWHHVRPQPGDHPEYLNALAAADGRFVAVGGVPFYLGGPVGSSIVLSSTDGYQWHASLTNLDRQLSAIAFGAGQWVVCAPSLVPAADYGLERIACVQSRVAVAAGENLHRGSVMDPQDYRLRLHLLSTRQLEFWGESGFECRLERSADLVDWDSASDWRGGIGDYLLWDWEKPTTAACFWRAASRPLSSYAEHDYCSELPPSVAVSMRRIPRTLHSPAVPVPGGSR